MAKKFNIILTKDQIPEGVLHRIDKKLGGQSYAPEVSGATVYDTVGIDEMHNAIHDKINGTEAKAQKGLGLAEKNAGEVKNNKESLAQIGERLDAFPNELIDPFLSDQEVVKSLVEKVRSSIDPILEEKQAEIDNLRVEIGELRAKLEALEGTGN